MNVLGSDGMNFSTLLQFSKSIITEDNGKVIGTWQSQDQNETSKATFDVSPDLSIAHLTFEGIAIISGSATWTARNPKSIQLPAREEDAKLGPRIHYIRPLPNANTTVITNLVFPQVAGKDDQKMRELRLIPEHEVKGGMDRVWSLFSWQQLITENYHLHASAGPYRLHVMSIISTVADGKVPYASARLYKDNQVLCTAQDAVSDGTIAKFERDYVVIKRVYSDDLDVVRGKFRDRNVGYDVEFVQQEGEIEKKRWKFEVRYVREWWNRPTSAPGPDVTGNSAFIVTVSGGLVTKGNGERLEGFGSSGQVELS